MKTNENEAGDGRFFEKRINGLLSRDISADAFFLFPFLANRMGHPDHQQVANIWLHYIGKYLGS